MMEEFMKPVSLLLAAAAMLAGIGQAFARAPTVLPEPSTLSVLGLAAVAGIVVWRIKRKK